MATAQLTVILQLTVDTDEAPRLTARLVDSVRAAVDVPIDGDQRIVIDPDSRRVTVHGVPVELTRLEFDLLLFLCSNPGRVHRRTTLLAEVWGVAEHLGSRTVDVHIRRLRDKIGFDPITTVRGVGYLVAPDAGFVIARS